MRHQEYQWQSFDQGNLFAQSFSPEQAPKAVISFVHGIGEHCSRYYDWFEKFTQKGITIVAFDYRGHGKSFGKRGKIKHYEHLMYDIDVLISHTKKIFPDTPHFLYGHSLGGHLVINYTVNYQPDLKGLISSSPWLILPQTPSKFTLRLAGLVHSVYPSLRLPTPLKSKDLSSDKEVVKKYERDPLMHNKISLELFFKAQSNNQKILSEKDIFHIPVALYHGSEDKMTSPLGSRRLSQNNPKNLTYTEYPNIFHELHNDKSKQALFESIVSFVESHL